MNFLNLFFKLRRSLILFSSSHKVWQFPSKCDIVIYDECGTEVLTPYFNNHSFNVLPTRGESYNMPCLLIATLTFLLRGDSVFSAYSDIFIKFCSPKLVVTCIDNNSEFYKISSRHHNLQTMFIQNGARGISGDVFESILSNKKFHVDYMLVFGSAIGNLYSKYISGSVLPVGSLKNNYFQQSCPVNKNRVLFISQFRRKPDNNLFYTDSNGPIYWSDFYKAEQIIVPYLENWCFQNKKILQVCGVDSENMYAEKQFYNKLLKLKSSEYIPSSGIYSGYQLVDSAEIVVFIDSTLGYESLARGQKTASFSCRLYGLLPLFNAFGWPADLPNSGPFWTNDLDVVKFTCIMNFLSKISDEEWAQVVSNYSPQLFHYDKGNSVFIDLLESILD